VSESPAVSRSRSPRWARAIRGPGLNPNRHRHLPAAGFFGAIKPLEDTIALLGGNGRAGVADVTHTRWSPASNANRNKAAVALYLTEFTGQVPMLAQQCAVGATVTPGWIWRLHPQLRSDDPRCLPRQSSTTRSAVNRLHISDQTDGHRRAPAEQFLDDALEPLHFSKSAL